MTREIDRLEAPTREYFEENYLMRNKPVILTGVGSQWPAVTKWNPDYLKQVAGDSYIQVHFDDHGDFHRWYHRPGGRVDKVMTLGEFIDLLLAEPYDQRYYMTEHELHLVSRELLQDIDLGGYLDRPHPLLFLGRDTFMPLHFHSGTEAVLCQLYGKKSITLYSPDQYSLLYPAPWYSNNPLFSPIDPRDPNVLERFPRFERAVPLQFTLEPGEILFIPVHWWHVTNVSGFQISSTSFWPARRECYHFPAPGLQVRARELLDSTSARLQRAKTWLREAIPSPN